MTDPRASVRVLDELLWRLRREGLVISTAQAVVAARALLATGLEEQALVRDALAAVVVDRARDRPRFDRAFDEFFAASRAPRGDLWERLLEKGFSPSEVEVLRELLGQLPVADPSLASLGTLLQQGPDLDRLLARVGIERSLDEHSGPQLGFVAHRVQRELGSADARRGLARLRAELSDALGPRGLELAAALAAELDRAGDGVRAHVRRAYEASVAAGLDARPREGGLGTLPFASLTPEEFEEVRRAVRLLAERLRGGARVRARRAVRGRVDPHRTLRRSLGTLGVPFVPVRRRRPRARPRLMLLCDVSDSVRSAALFLLEFTYAVQELFDGARTFVFVSDLGETTEVFEKHPVRIAIAKAWDGSVVRAGDNSNYGRVLRTFVANHLGAVDRRTTVVIVGDGRSNYHDPEPELLDRIRERAHALLWLCPEPRGLWGSGDSAMGRYASRCTAVHEVRCAADLERAARALLARR